MVSTYLGYEIYARDLSKSQQRVGDEVANQTAKAYYDANIGKVKSVDDFIGNYRLFSYAMKAYGLEDMTYAKGLMRQVLTSDLTDSKSVANKLSGAQYLAFAKAFNFTTKGAVAPTSVQGSDQQGATVALFKSNTALTLTSTVATAATTYYQAHIGSVTSVAALEKDPKLYQYVLTAYGLDPTATSKKTFEGIIEGDLSSATSLVNTTAGAGYLALTTAVNVDTSGAASTVAQAAQSKAAIATTVSGYAANARSDTASQKAIKTETAYYGSAISAITSVDDLLSDRRMVAYIDQAFNLPASATTGMLRQVLTSDTSDPKSFVNRLSDPRYKDLATSFNFATDGSIRTEAFQSEDQQHATVALYAARQTADTAAVDAETAYYEANIGSVKTVADLEGNARLKAYILTAYGVGSSTPPATVDDLLENNANAQATLSRTTGASYLSLASAFNVDASGNATVPLQAQADDALASTATAYTAAAKSDSASQAAARKETNYFKSAIADVTSVGALLSDGRLVAYIRQAFALPASTSNDKLKQVLTSDLSSKRSVANKMGGAYVKLAQAFSFGTNGLLASQPAQQAQSVADRVATDANYIRQSLEAEAGDQNTGIKLALYFQRVAPTITDAYSILADKALLEVFQTTLGLSATSSKADIDVQANYLKSKINFADLRDPVKLNKMIQRFSILYDMNNQTSDSANNVSLLFGSS